MLAYAKSFRLGDFVNAVEGEDDLVCFVMTDREAQVVAGLELELEFAELIGYSLGQRRRSRVQPDGHFLSCPVAACPVQDLPYYARGIRIPARFETEINVVIIRFVKKLPRRD